MPRISFPVQKDIINIFELTYHADGKIHPCLLLIASEENNNDELLTLPDGFEDTYGKTGHCDEYVEDTVELLEALKDRFQNETESSIVGTISELCDIPRRYFEINEEGFEGLLIIPDVSIHRSFYSNWEPVFEEDGFDTLCEIANV